LQTARHHFTSMMLLASERQVIESAFGCKPRPVRCEEVGLIACGMRAASGLHLSIEHLLRRIPAAGWHGGRPGEEGAIVITDLLNRGMRSSATHRGCGCHQIGAVPADAACRSWSESSDACGLPQAPRRSMVAGVSLVERTLTADTGGSAAAVVQPSFDDIVRNVVRAPRFQRRDRAGAAH